MNSTTIDRSLKHIKAYLKSYYGSSVKIEEAPERSNLRLQTKNKYHYFILHFLDEQFVLAISEGHWLPHRCHVDKEHIEKKYQLDCVFYFEKLRTYQKRSLIKNKVNFITYQKDVFIPIIGEILVQRNSHACFRSMSNFRRSGFGLYTDWDKFSSYEQQVFFYIYLHRNRGFR